MLILLVRMVLMFRGPLGYDENGRENKSRYCFPIDFWE